MDKIYHAYHMHHLCESMNLFVANLSDEFESKNENLLDIIFDTLHKGLYHMTSWSEFETEYYQRNRPLETFDPQEDAFAPTGIIEFNSRGLSKRLIKQGLENIEQLLNDQGFTYNILQLWYSEDSDAYGKYAINIITNPFDGKEMDTAPSVTYSNSNMIRVLRALGLDDIAEEYGGTIDVNELLMRVRNSADRIEAQVRAPYDSDMDKFRAGAAAQERKGAHVIDSGLSSEDIVRRLGEIEQVAVWAKEHGYNTIAIG